VNEERLASFAATNHEASISTDAISSGRMAPESPTPSVVARRGSRSGSAGAARSTPHRPGRRR
jgi:hypothetical protein